MCEQKGGKFSYLNGGQKRKSESVEEKQKSWKLNKPVELFVWVLVFFCREGQHEQQIARKCYWNLPPKHQSSGFSIKAPCSLLPLIFRLPQPPTSWCIRVRAARHSLSNRHYGVCFHVPPQHVSHLPVHERLEPGALGKSYTSLGWVSFGSAAPLLALIFYYTNSFAWIVATLFGITGYATFTTLSQGNLFFHLILIAFDKSL